MDRSSAYAALKVDDPWEPTEQEKLKIKQVNMAIVSFIKVKFDYVAHVIGTDEDVSRVIEDLALVRTDVRKKRFTPESIYLLDGIGEYVHLANSPVPMDYDVVITSATGETATFRHVAVRANSMTEALKAAAHIASTVSPAEAANVKIKVEKFPRGEWSKHALTP